MGKKVAVLGAGPSGLVAAKEALENGMVPTIFEKTADLGGVWNLTTGSVWNTMHTNISKYTTSFGDTHWSAETEMFPSAQQMYKYLTDYAQKWNIKENIKFHSNVVKVSPVVSNGPTGSNGWTVEWINEEDPSSSNPKSELFHGVIVASGIFAKGNIPSLPGLESFPNKIIHSKEYKTGSDFVGLKIMTIGGSFSGVEIAADVSKYSAESIHCFKEPFWILNRYLPNKKTGKTNIPLDLLFYTRSFYSQQQIPSKEQTNKLKNKNLESVCQEQNRFEQLFIPPEKFGAPINVAVSDVYLNQVEQKKLIPEKQTILEIKGSKVILQNGKVYEPDVIIFATGFHVELNFLDEIVLQKILYDQSDRVQPVILFNECCHPDLENLFFVGLYKGPYFGVMEQQARLAARILSGTVSLPPSEILEEGLKQEIAIREARPRPQFPHPEYVFFADTISKYAKSFPDLNKFESDESTLADALGKPLNENSLQLEQKKREIYNRFMTESVTPSHYNLVHDPVETLHQMDLLQESMQ